MGFKPNNDLCNAGAIMLYQLSYRCTCMKPHSWEQVNWLGSRVSVKGLDSLKEVNYTCTCIMCRLYTKERNDPQTYYFVYSADLTSNVLQDAFNSFCCQTKFSQRSLYSHTNIEIITGRNKIPLQQAF